MPEMDNHSWKILLVEDDEEDYFLTRAYLSDIKAGQFKLDWVTTFEAGLEAFLSCKYDVGLIDYRLGERDGLELVSAALAAGCRAPIILMTGQGSYDVDVEAMRVGATDYLVKEEVTAALLERTIRYAIENKQAEALLEERNEALRKAHDELEERVRERTHELAEANEKLRAENAERLRAEKALRASELRFRTLAETTSSAIFILEGTRVRYANPAARTITGYSPDELLDQDFWMIAHPTYREILKKSGLVNPWKTSTEAGEPVVPIPVRYEIKLQTKSGEERWADVTAGEMEYDGKPARVVTVFDITERDLAEQALQKAKSELEARVAERTEELRRANELLRIELLERQRAAEEREHLLTQVYETTTRIEVQRRLIQNREMERLHIAQELHDGPLQELIGIEFLLKDTLQAAITRDPSSDRLLKNLINMQDALDGQIHELRLFCSELRPPTLAPFGLEKAILSHAESFRKKHPALSLKLELASDRKQLPESVRLALFRIYQELLNNALRHSGASEALVRLVLEDKQVIFQVQDNGCGFEIPSDWVELARQGHLGLVGVLERAEALGGQVHVHSKAGEGTSVLVTIPIGEIE